MSPRARRPAVIPAHLLAAASVIGLCACAPGEDPVARAGGAIIGGSPTEGDPAVVLLASYPPDHTTLDTCTASVIAADVLLTAAHCLDPDTHPGYLFGVFTGPDASAYPTASTLIPELLPVKEVVIHPDYDPAPPFPADIGVVILEEPLTIEPLPLQREPLDESIVGEPARIVGYGQIKYKEPNAVKHAASTTVAELGAGDTVTVGDLEHRSCIGDSGGPALVALGGVERVVGVDSYTELSGCLEPARYRRTDVYTSFIDVYAPPPAAGGSGGAGGDGGGSGEDGGAGGGATGGGCSLGPAPASGSAPAVALMLLALARVLRRGNVRAGSRR